MSDSTTTTTTTPTAEAEVKVSELETMTSSCTIQGLCWICKYRKYPVCRCEEIRETQIACSKLMVYKLHPDAQLPERKSKQAAGYDLTSVEDVTIPAQGKAAVKTGIAIRLPDDTWGRIAPRSGLAVNFHIDIGAGVIDPDYRGEVTVVMFNHSPTNNYEVKAGQRIAQLILHPLIEREVLQVQDQARLGITARGFGGFGSTDRVPLVEDDKTSASAVADKTATPTDTIPQQ